MGVFNGVLFYLFSGELNLITVYGVNLFYFISLWNAPHLSHSNIKYTFPRWLNFLLISPYHHHYHHSKNPKHFDKNFGDTIAIWDYLAGTLVLPDLKDKLQFGLARDEHKEFKGIFKMLYLPFKKIRIDFNHWIKPKTFSMRNHRVQ